MAQKTLYHSELVKMGPVTVTVKSEVFESKFKGKPPYVVLEIDGEERNYSTENVDCASFFDGQKGERFTLCAEGRDDNATISYVGAPAQDLPKSSPVKPPRKDGPPARRAEVPAAAREAASGAPDEDGQVQDTPRNAGPPQRASQAPPMTRVPKPMESPEERLARAKMHANRAMNLWILCYKVGTTARQAVRDQLGDEMEQGQFQAMVSTFFVQLSRDGFVSQMPTGILDIHPPAPAPTPDPDKDGR